MRRGAVRRPTDPIRCAAAHSGTPLPVAPPSPIERRNPPREVRCQPPHRLQLPPDPVDGASPSASKLHARARRVQQCLHPPPCSILRRAQARRPGEGRRWPGVGATGRDTILDYRLARTDRPLLCVVSYGKRVKNTCYKCLFQVFQMS